LNSPSDRESFLLRESPKKLHFGICTTELNWPAVRNYLLIGFLPEAPVRKLALLLLVLFPCLFKTTNVQAEVLQTPATEPAGSVNGRWVLSADFYGTPLDLVLRLQRDGEKLAGDLDGSKLEGTAQGNAIHFFVAQYRAGKVEGSGTIQGAAMTGTVIYTESSSPEHPTTLPFTAKLVQQRSGPPQRHEFVPTTFYRQFSARYSPVLTVSAGDTIHTTTVDAGGKDEKGATRSMGGNPETGPFYVESALPGDTLVVHIVRLRLNRDWAISDDSIVDRGMDSDLAVKMKDSGKDVRWHLDIQRGVATPEKPSEHLARYSVPVKPMLGCVAVATRGAAPGTGDSGYYGGNMDFNEIIEGATVYLPVSVPGALLYVGDGHAVEGDGELTGNALETSMDVEFTVDVISGKSVPEPRVESATHIMAMGLNGSIDDAFREATSNMAQWLTDDYKLTPSEVAQVLGTSAEYKVSEVADRNAGVVLKIRKELLQPLK
jgi:amidase